MTRKSKKFLSFLLVLTLLMGAMPMSVFAAGETTSNFVAEVNGVQYTSWKDAWNKVKNGGTITMLSDWKTSGALEVNEGKKVTVEMKGHMINRGQSANGSKSDGEVFYLNDKSTLILDGGTEKTTHAGILIGNNVWVPGTKEGSTAVTITGAVVTGGHSSNGAGGIHMKDNTHLELINVSVVGNKADRYASADGYGGGIMVDGDPSKIIMKNSTIAYNYAERDGGGIYICDEKCKIQMDKNSSIKENVAGQWGGGVYMHAENGSITGEFVLKNRHTGEELDHYHFSHMDVKAEMASIHNNRSKKSGAGVYVNSGSCKLSGLEIYGNTITEKDSAMGAGVYMDQGAGASVSKCYIRDNKTEGNGGGIYVDGNGGSLSDSTVINNSAKRGGGIFIDQGDTLALSGELYVRLNIASDQPTDNEDRYDDIYLKSDDKHGYISGEPRTGDVRVGWDPEKRKGDNVVICNTKGAYDADFLHSNVDGYNIYWSWGTKDGKNDRKIHAIKGDGYKLPAVEKITYDVGYKTVDEDGYVAADEKKYPLQRGVYSYKGMNNGDRAGIYYFSEGYFAEDPKTYNEHLSTMSLVLTSSIFATEYNVEDPDGGNSDAVKYMNKFANAMQLLSDLGFADENIYVNDYFMEKPSTDGIGVIMGAKELSHGDVAGTILIPIAVRGQGYDSEWASNVTLGADGEAQGFSEAATQVLESLDDFIATCDLDIQKALKEGRVKFWVTGFSRAAATANLTAKRLTDEYGAKNDVFAYCFEAPKGGQDPGGLEAEGYFNIHNIINTGDVVPLVGPEEMGFQRYGVDHYVPGSPDTTTITSISKPATSKNYDRITTHSDNQPYEVSYTEGTPYFTQKTKMNEHLRALTDAYVFDDYFHVATLGVTTKGFGEKGSLDTMSAAEFLPLFVEKLQDWAANGYKRYKYVFIDGFPSLGIENDNCYDPRGDYREHYAEHELDYWDSTTIEKSLRVATELMMGMSGSESSAMMDSAIKSLLDYGFFNQLDLGTDLIMDGLFTWDSIAQYEQKWLIDDLWDSITGKKGIGKELTPKQLSDLEEAFPVLIDFVLRFASTDWDKKSISGVDDTMMMVGTMAYNSGSILQTHYPEVVMAWLRSYDSFYDNETDKMYVDLNKVDKPSVEIEIQESTTGSAIVALDARYSAEEDIKGTAIYYRIQFPDDNSSTSSAALNGWQLYRKPFTVHNIQNQDVTVTVEAFTVRQKAMSDVASEAVIIAPAEYVDMNMEYQYADGSTGAGITSSIQKGEQSLVHADKYGEKATTTYRLRNSAPEKKARWILVDWENVDESLLDGIPSDGTVQKVVGKDGTTITAKYAYLAEYIHITASDTSGSGITAEVLSGETEESAVTVNSSHYTMSGGGSNIITLTFETNNETNLVFGKRIVARVNGDLAVAQYNEEDGSVSVTYTRNETSADGEAYSVYVDCYDLNLKEDADGGLMDTVQVDTVTTTEGQIQTVMAPKVEGMKFQKWECYVKDSTTTEAALTVAALAFKNGSSETTEAISFVMPESDVLLHANYIPEIQQVDLVIQQTKPTDPLPTTFESCKLTIQNDYYIENIKEYDILWVTDNQETFGPLPVGVLDIFIFDDGDFIKDDEYPSLDIVDHKGNVVNADMEFAIAEDVVITINGNPNGYMSKVDFGSFGPQVTTLSFVMERSEKTALISISNPEPMTVGRDFVTENGISDDWLPWTVSVEVADQTVRELGVTWDGSFDFDEDDLGKQTFTITGKVDIPDFVTNPHNVSTEVEMEITVAAAPKAETPEPSLEPGEFSGSTVVRFFAEEGATIKYKMETNSGESGWITYTDPITLEESTILTAYAEEDGKRDSGEFYGVYIEKTKKPSSGSSNTTTTVEKNEDGTTTTTTVNKVTGTVSETTKTEDGTSATVVTDKTGTVTEVSAQVSEAAAEAAQQAGDVVTLPVEVTAAKDSETAVVIDVKVPEDGATVEIPVNDVTAGTIVVLVKEDGTEEMMKQSVVSEDGVIIALDESAEIKIIDGSRDFTDVPDENYWASAAIDFVTARKIYNGTSDTTFHPNNTMTRGMLAMVLHNLEGNPDAESDLSFPDVKDGAWYEEAVLWAAEEGIVSGYPNGKYGSNDAITREQLAVMLWKYAGAPASDHSLNGFTDQKDISNYAKTAMAWANQNGIINGMGGDILNPKGYATRAQVAQMIKNYLEGLYL